MSDAKGEWPKKSQLPSGTHMPVGCHLKISVSTRFQSGLDPFPRDTQTGWKCGNVSSVALVLPEALQHESISKDQPASVFSILAKYLFECLACISCGLSCCCRLGICSLCPPSLPRDSRGLMRSKYRVNPELSKANISARARPPYNAAARHHPTLPATGFSLTHVVRVILVTPAKGSLQRNKP